MHFKPILGIALLSLFFLYACKWLGKKEEPNTVSIKDKSISEMPIPELPTTSGDYTKEWAAVDSLERQGLPKSALEAVLKIETQARKDNKHAQVIKCAIYHAKFLSQMDEDGVKKGIQIFEEGAATASNPIQKAVFQSLCGEIYAQYLRNNSWYLQDRTPVSDEGGDILTWSAAQIQRRALHHYMASVQRTRAILAEPAQSFQDIILPGRGDTVNNEALRPNLYDLLCSRAIDYFQNDQNYLSEPTYAFELNQPAAFAKRMDFVNFNFESKDSSSGKWLALKTFQDLLRDVQKFPRSKSAILDADLARLKFVKNASSQENAKELYRSALLELRKENAGHPAESEILYELALLRQDDDNPAEASKKSIEAVALLEEGIKLHPDSYGAKLCQMQLANIRAVTLSTEVEQVNYPGNPILYRINYRNVNQLWARVVAQPEDQEWQNNTFEYRVAILRNRKSVQNRDWTWKSPQDYQDHSTELSLQALPPGEYVLLTSVTDAFDPKQGAVALTPFKVSRIALVHFSEPGSESVFVSTDRNSGTPLPGVKIDMYTQDWRSGKYELNLTESVTTGKDGMVKKGLPLNSNLLLRASLDGDSLWSGNAYNYQSEPIPEQNHVHFFSDRAIYRPGQSVYFKGIYYKTDKDQKPSILPNKSVTVKFMDANGQEKAKQSYKTNEYGTFNGVFTAPSAGLTGQMSIQEESSGEACYFSVEEYKRPKFEVTLKPIEGNYRVGDQLTVKGSAQNFAGSAVDAATVKYRVQRVARFPYYDYWSFWKRPYTRSSSREIAFGTVQTDANGNFEISFKAEPDLSIPKKDLPVFDYEIFADVMDISGETQSGQSQVSAAYTALQVQWGLPEEIHLDSLKKVAISANNFAGQAQKVEGSVNFQRLVEPKQAYIKRLWANPDVQAIPKTEFTQDFPLFAFGDADQPAKWDRMDNLIPFSFDTEKGKTTDLNNGKIQPGYYSVVLETQDAFGEKIRVEKIVRVFDDKSRYEDPSAETDKASYEPGETAKIAFGSRMPQFFFYALQRQNEVNMQWAEAKNKYTLPVSITEKDRGGLAFHWFAVRNNRFYGQNAANNIAVPWSNKDLNIKYETFRDKLLPGQKEEWRIRISGAKKEKVAAEMVAAMYDASLDQFAPHGWYSIEWPYLYGEKIQMDNGNSFSTRQETAWFTGTSALEGVGRTYPDFNWFGYAVENRQVLYSRMKAMPMADMAVGGAPPPPPAPGYSDQTNLIGGEFKAEDASMVLGEKFTPPTLTTDKPSQAPPASLRTNLKETVFFFPDLRTDANGDILVKFTMNEALTRWKFLAFVHTKGLEQVLSTKEIVTQKELMVLPNTPRFLRAGDNFEFSTKVSNLSQSPQDGTVSLLLMDANTLQPINDKFGLNTAQQVQKFSAAPGQSAAATWMVKVPEEFSGALTWRIFAESKNFTDGEESSLPVVTNRMLVTETLPISLRGNQSKTFTFENLKNANSSTLKTQNYSIEFSSNPVWYAVQALPYLMEYPHECSEQMFSRFYANSLASSVTEKMPAIKRVYERWKGTDALKSNLSKNQELKYALLEETPWVMAAQSEEQQKQQIALLFDLNRMAAEREKAINTLAERQYPSGGWPWFPGGEASWSITQHILCGFKHLEKLGAYNGAQDQTTSQMVSRAGDFCYAEMLKSYRKLEEEAQAGRAKMEDDHLDGLIIQFLYATSFQQKVDRPSKEMAYYYGQAEKFWLGKGLYQEAMLALILHRNGRTEAAQRIVKSLKERATIKEELGMYWPVEWGYSWYQLPVETQAIMVEVFQEVAQDARAVEDLRIWLLKNKQTNRWASTKATAEAVYALLLSDGQPNKWLDNNRPVQITLGSKTLKPSEYEPGTGYFKQSWAGSEVKSSWSTIKVENPNSNIVWGAAYWQYFEDLDKIKDFQKTPLTITKQLFVEENTQTGPVLRPVADGQLLSRGTKLKVRIEIRVDRPMEFVHLKDMRAAGFEPVNVLSSYRYQGGLGYYESTKDLATHFFIDYLPRGTFVFEYPLVVTHRGDMSNGITTMQCMYAPEFTSHSKGVRVKVQ